MPFKNIKTYGLTLKGALLTHYLAFDHQESTPCDYYELFIPVKALTN